MGLTNKEFDSEGSANTESRTRHLECDERLNGDICNTYCDISPAKVRGVL